jgi:hypothetical protein
MSAVAVLLYIAAFNILNLSFPEALGQLYPRRYAHFQPVIFDHPSYLWLKGWCNYGREGASFYPASRYAL